MKVTVKFLANMGIFMGIRELNLELDDGKEYTIKDIIERITRETGKDLKGKIMDERGQSTGRVRIVLNGRDIVSLSRFDTKVADGDNISMFPALGAG
ncbi:MAG: MoaD family protein [Candidatus Odinarchaeum yellowstonii]|uniref:MoaD family protein n=1 Tax=Odinarchaeota yellowstonii (strain LCB_4) TaxID=1841599 RepID=A0AAF0D1G2_ODILC|nr:MAG: MoaD family protein [Candidatus Odinarchaeum yellowstonii]